MLYEIQPTGPARRLATQKVGYDQQRKLTAAAQIVATLGIYHFPDGAKRYIQDNNGGIQRLTQL